MTHRINFTVLDLNLFLWTLIFGRRCDCSVSLYITHPCNDIYWWRSMYYTIKNIVHWRGFTSISRIETFVYVTCHLCIKYLFDNSYIMIYRSNNCIGLYRQLVLIWFILGVIESFDSLVVFYIFFLRVYPENMVVIGQHCISKHFLLNLSFTNKTTIKYKINLINFIKVVKIFKNIVLYHNYHIF